MIPKQHEMDGIVRDIYEALETNEHLQSTLLVVCGDHGMNNAGNHGASSPGETSPALLFVSPKLKEISSGSESPILPKGDFDYYNMVEQSDIAPTIAALLGFPVPKNNLGAFIPDFLPFWPKASDKVQILLRNARQILNIVTAAFGPEAFDGGSESAGSADPCALTGDVNELACSWRRLNQEADIQANADDVDQAWLSATSEWLRKAQDLMSSMASNYEMPKLYIGHRLNGSRCGRHFTAQQRGESDTLWADDPPLWYNDVCEQLRRGRAALLVLVQHHVAGVSRRPQCTQVSFSFGDKTSTKAFSTMTTKEILTPPCFFPLPDPTGQPRPYSRPWYLSRP